MPKSFEDLMNTPGDQIKPPPLVPIGTYLVGIMGPPNEVLSSQKQTPGRELRYKFYQARADVDQSALAKMQEEYEMSLTDIEMTDTFYITDKSLNMYKQFWTKVLKIPESHTPRQAESEMSGKQLLIHIRHRPRQDGSGLFAEIDDRKPAE